VDKVFKNQIDQNIEAYVDEILVKSMTFEQHLQDLKEIFYALH
jgi:L-rhamnose mutarotase